MNKITILLPLLSMLLKQGRHELNLKNDQGHASHLVSWLVDLSVFLSSLREQVSIKGLLVTLMLALIIAMSAIGVVQSSHLSRQLFAEQALLLERNDQLQLEWAQLLLEQSAWSSPNRLESIASQKLGMSMPEAEEIQLVY